MVVYLVLTARIVMHRLNSKIGIGDGGDKALTLKIRAHGNFAEYVPLALLLLAFVEHGGGSRALVGGLGAALVLGRVAHGIGLSSRAGYSMARFSGTVLTLTVLTVAAIVNVMLALSRL